MSRNMCGFGQRDKISDRRLKVYNMMLASGFESGCDVLRTPYVSKICGSADVQVSSALIKCARMNINTTSYFVHYWRKGSE